MDRRSPSVYATIAGRQVTLVLSPSCSGRRLAEAGAEAIVLAGTDLNLAFDGQSPGYEVIDALDVHVALLADLAMNRISLDRVTA